MALCASTGKFVIGVFHTLSAGKAGQFVPGKTGAVMRADAFESEELERVFAVDATGVTRRTSPATTNETAPILARRRRRERVMDSMHTVYFEFAKRHPRLSKSCAATQDFEPSSGA